MLTSLIYSNIFSCLLSSGVLCSRGKSLSHSSEVLFSLCKVPSFLFRSYWGAQIGGTSHIKFFFFSFLVESFLLLYLYVDLYNSSMIGGPISLLLLSLLGIWMPTMSLGHISIISSFVSFTNSLPYTVPY